MSRFIDPTTDFGFKKLFGDEANKDITMGFLADVLELSTPLQALGFLDKEQLPETVEERAGVYDLFCRDVVDNSFIVEMQKSRIGFIKDRLLYYATFPLAAQAKKGKLGYYEPPSFAALSLREVATATYGGREVAPPIWDYSLKPVYCIAILGYVLDGSKKAVNRSSLRYEDSSCASYYDKLSFVTLELPLFDERQPEYSLERRLNQWLYFIKYLSDFEEIPEIFKNDAVFQKAFYVAALSNLTRAERWQYELSLKRMRDMHAVLSTSFNRGKAEGKSEGKIEGGRETLLLLLTQKFGPLPNDVTAAIFAIQDVERMNQIWAYFAKINDWETLRKYLLSPTNGNTDS